jgi:hypothetical protein
LEATRKKKRDGGRRASNHQRRMGECTEPPGDDVSVHNDIIAIRPDIDTCPFGCATETEVRINRCRTDVNADGYINYLYYYFVRLIRVARWNNTSSTNTTIKNN